MLQSGKFKQKHRRLLKAALSCNPCAALLLALGGGGVNPAISEGFGTFWNIGKFRSLGAEKEEKFYSSHFRLIVSPLSGPLPEGARGPFKNLSRKDVREN